MVNTERIYMMDGETTLAEVIANANIVPRRSTYNSPKLQGEIIYDVEDGNFYGNHASDGSNEDWQLLGGGSGNSTQSPTFTINYGGEAINSAIIFDSGAYFSRLLWVPEKTRFDLDYNDSLTDLRLNMLIARSGIRFTDNVDDIEKYKIEKNDTTGNLEIIIKEGQYLVFKTG